MSRYSIRCLQLFCLCILLTKVRTNETLPFDDVSTEWWTQTKYKLMEKEFPNALVTTMLQYLEENMAFYEKNLWSFDVRAGLSIFLIKLSALYLFTEVPWLTFLPSLEDANMASVTMALQKTLAMKERLKQYKPWPEDYSQDLIKKTKEAQEAEQITLKCLEMLTMNIVQEEAIAKANNGSVNKTFVPPYKCRFPKKIRAMCLDFIHRGKPSGKAYGHTNFYRIAMITAARFARNCFFFSVENDKKILNYLCYLAMVQVSKFEGVTQDPTYYTTADPLTVTDLANICLLNGNKNFLLEAALKPCRGPELQWNKTGCFGPKGNRIQTNQTVPKPLWVVTVNDNLHKNGFCNRRLTHSCLAYFSSVVRSIVEIGSVRPQLATTPSAGSGADNTSSTEWLPLRR